MTNRDTAYRTNDPLYSYLYEYGTATYPDTANEGYVQADDGVSWYNTTPLPEKVTSNAYQFKNWGFTLPYPDSLPTWIRVEFQSYHTDVAGNGTPSLTVRIKKSDAAAISATNNVGSFATTLTKNADDNNYQVVANSADDSTKLFGLTLTKAELESNQFSLVAHYVGDNAQNGATAYCYTDILRARIEYSLRVAPAQHQIATSFGTITFGHRITVPVGTVGFTGYAPTVTGNVSANVLVDVPVGTVALTGYAPTFTASDFKLVEVPAGALAVTGYAPTFTASDFKLVDVPAGAVAITGYAPTATASDHQVFAVPVGAIAVAGYAPTITTPRLISVPAGAVAITGLAPTVTASDHKVFTIPAGTVSITGYEPSLPIGDAKLMEPSVGAVAIAGQAPTVTATDFKLVEVPVVAVTLTGYAPDAIAGTTLAPVLSLVAATSITGATIIPQVAVNF